MALAIRRQPVTAGELKQTSGERLASLDVFRGATMALMVLVNNSGDGSHTYGPLQHADWHGWTLTDTVFPSFLWIVGVAVTLSLGKRLMAGVSRTRLFAQVLRRAAIIYVLGLVVYAYPLDLSTQRLLGVLQRIAICYLIVSAIYLTTGVRGQLIWIVSLLSGYWLIMMLAPTPGYGAGHLDLQRNFAHYVDSMVLGRHNYLPTKTWDPEGIVSTIPAIATALFGIMAGHILRMRRELAERTTWLFLAGNILIALGLICNVWLPINKKLWTSSYVLFAAGATLLVLAICFFLVEVRQWKRAWTFPWIVFGSNAIVAYIFSELLAATLFTLHVERAGQTANLQSLIYDKLFSSIVNPSFGSLLYSLAYAAVCFVPVAILYRKRMFIKI